MEKIQKTEEALSIIWEEREKKISDIVSIKNRILEKIGEDFFGNLVNEGLVSSDKNTVRFTGKGEETAKDVIRRQRLAERLLIDVLELGRGVMASSACEFEHILSKEIEEGICTLLGHPKECPHGLPIPRGGCCLKAKTSIESIVVPLSKLAPGESAKVAYVLTREHPQLHKLMSLGVVPAARVSVHQVFPSFVIQVEETYLALEEGVAKDIYVRRSNG